MTLVFLNHQTIQQSENCNHTEYLSTSESSPVSYIENPDINRLASDLSSSGKKLNALCNMFLLLFSKSGHLNFSVDEKLTCLQISQVKNLKRLYYK